MTITLTTVLKQKEYILNLLQHSGYTNVKVYKDKTEKSQTLSILVDKQDSTSFQLNPAYVADILTQKLGCITEVTIAANLKPLFKEDTLKKSVLLSNQAQLIKLFGKESPESIAFKSIKRSSEQKEVASSVLRAKKIMSQHCNSDTIKELFGPVMTDDTFDQKESKESAAEELKSPMKKKQKYVPSSLFKPIPPSSSSKDIGVNIKLNEGYLTLTVPFELKISFLKDEKSIAEKIKSSGLLSQIINLCEEELSSQHEVSNSI